MNSADIEKLVAEADLASLLPALAYATGDLSVLRDELTLDPLLSSLPDNGWTPEQIDLARTVATGALGAHLAGPASTPAGDVQPIIEWIAGRPLDDDYTGMLLEELSIDGDQRGPSWHLDDDDRAISVAVIGGGMSGILTAHRLGQAGVEYVLLEKNQALGGTWLENAYPGCRVDLPNHVYSYSNNQRTDWPFHHSTQDVLRDYFQDSAASWCVTEHTRFGVRVASMRWDDTTNEWELDLETCDGSETMRATAVVSAVGQLNRPKMPDIAGRDSFTGQAFHSARWPTDLDLAGKRVAVIGTGASAMQFIPHVAEEAEQLTVFQRTPAWLLDRPVYHEPLSSEMLTLCDLVPDYHHWYRLRQFWQIHHGALDALRRDPDWDGPLERAVSPMNEMMREALTDYLTMQFADRPDLLGKVVPDYPVGAKRFVLDNGIWARTLSRDNVTLVTEPIAEITPTGVRTDDRAHHEVDVVIYGTGFDASRFLTPMTVIGRNGANLHDRWGDDARAYLGMTVPDFPNLFCLYGPNTNIVFNGSIIFFSECAARYIVDAMALLAHSDLSRIEIRDDVYRSFVEAVDQRNSEMAWGISAVNSWYKSRGGGIAQNWPFPLIDYWKKTRTPNRVEFVDC